MDKIVTQLEEAWTSGIWTWDCVVKDHVLVIPFVAALLGDNPMQSEFSCHLGGGGKFFCQMCEVKGFDSSDPPISLEPDQGDQAEQVARHVNGTNGESSNEDAGSVTRGRSKRQETMQEMINRMSRFIEIGVPWNRVGTLNELQAIVGEAGSVGNLTKIRNHKTKMGLKDTFLEVFLGRMYLSYKDKAGRLEKQRALDEFRATLPANILSPVLTLTVMVTFDLSLT
ncbi:hypothetical protein EI94DRAFT_1813228 [Lactarius quietus]|nr:hypothetical protein EI94DRAFT_1813228 [Lactarius quietus]